jgi:hypothetical protein
MPASWRYSHDRGLSATAGFVSRPKNFAAFEGVVTGNGDVTTGV